MTSGVTFTLGGLRQATGRPAELDRLLPSHTLEERPTNAGRWTTRSMARATGLSQTTIVRIWMAHGLRPRGSKGHKPVSEMVGQLVRLYPNRSKARNGGP